VSGADGSEVDVAIPAGRALGVVRETARLLAAERLRAAMRLAFWLSPSASSRSAGPIHGSGWIESKISWRFQLSKGTAAYPRCGGRYRLFGFSVGCYGRTGQLREALAHSASRNRAAAATATLSVTSTWQTGFIAHFTITNSSTVPLTDWKLEFDLPVGESVSHTWNSTLAQSGTHYVLTPANWNRIIAPGGSATGGL